MIAMPHDKAPSGVELGRFTLDRIVPMRKGTVQVDVSMFLGQDQTVRVSACNRQNDHTISLNIRDKFKYLKF